MKKRFQSVNELPGFVRLRDKMTTCRKFVFARHELAGRDDQIDRRPALAYSRSQFQAVHASRHVDVGKNDPNVASRLQNFDRFFGVGRLERVKTGFLNDIDGVKPQ